MKKHPKKGQKNRMKLWNQVNNLYLLKRRLSTKAIISQTPIQMIKKSSSTKLFEVPATYPEISFPTASQRSQKKAKVMSKVWTTSTWKLKVQTKCQDKVPYKSTTQSKTMTSTSQVEVQFQNTQDSQPGWAKTKETEFYQLRMINCDLIFLF